jgi:hypothetical protein
MTSKGISVMLWIYSFSNLLDCRFLYSDSPNLHSPTQLEESHCICSFLQGGVPVIGLLDHKPLICGSLIAVRGKASTPLNTIIMFVPQQEVNMDIFNFYIAISLKIIMEEITK